MRVRAPGAAAPPHLSLENRWGVPLGGPPPAREVPTSVRAARSEGCLPARALSPERLPQASMPAPRIRRDRNADRMPVAGRGATSGSTGTHPHAALTVEE